MLKSSLLLAALLLPVFSAANAEDYKAGDLLVSDPWSQELPPECAHRRGVLRDSQHRC